MKADRHNLHDQFTLSVEKDDVIVGHICTLEDFLYVHFISKARFAT